MYSYTKTEIAHHKRRKLFELEALMTASRFCLVHSNGSKILEQEYVRPGNARLALLNEVTKPNSRANLLVGDHIYAVPTGELKTDVDRSKLPAIATHVFRITAQDVVCERTFGTSA